MEYSEEGKKQIIEKLDEIIDEAENEMLGEGLLYIKDGQKRWTKKGMKEAWKVYQKLDCAYGLHEKYQKAKGAEE